MKKRSLVVQRRLNSKKQNRQLERDILEAGKVVLMAIGIGALCQYTGLVPHDWYQGVDIVGGMVNG